MSKTTDNTDTATQGYQGSNKPTAGRWTEDAAEEETEKKKGKRRGWISTCRNNGATKAVADREVRGHGSDPPPPLPQPPSPPPPLSEIMPLCTGAGIAQLVQRPTEKTGPVLTRVRVPGAAKVFVPESTFRFQCLTLSVQPPCAIAGINICVHVKNPKHWQPYHCLDTRKYCTL